MATSSSDESSATPKDFHLSSSLDSGSQLGPSRQKCPLCGKFRKRFYCKECIVRGDFCSTKRDCDERLAAKQERLDKVRTAAAQLEDNCSLHLTKRAKAEELHSKIVQHEYRVALLEIHLKNKRLKHGELQKQLDELSKGNRKKSANFTSYKDQNKLITNKLEKTREGVQKLRTLLNQLHAQLKQLSRVRIRQLIQYIFPISVVQPKSEIESSEQDMVTALAEASRTTFIRDHWVYTDHSGELQHCIVAPSLPGSGNYSAYNDWVAQNEDATPGSAAAISIEQNPAYSISAALTYTAQLVNLLGFYLDVRLPYKLSYRDFSGSDVEETKFNSRVARLNANILHLCFTQNTNLEALMPSRTLHNILQLLDTDLTDLGRQGPMEVEPQQANGLENELSVHLQGNEDSDPEEVDALANGWEAVPHVQIEAGPIHAPSVHMTTTQQASYMAGGLVTSAAASIVSIWRGWTGGR